MSDVIRISKLQRAIDALQIMQQTSMETADKDQDEQIGEFMKKYAQGIDSALTTLYKYIPELGERKL